MQEHNIKFRLYAILQGPVWDPCQSSSYEAIQMQIDTNIVDGILVNC